MSVCACLLRDLNESAASVFVVLDSDGGIALNG